MLVVGNGNLITRDAENPFISNGAVVIEGKLIKDLGTTEEMKKKYPGSEFIDAKGGVIMPGLINAHQHYYSTMARGMAGAGGKPPEKFSDILKGLWWRLDKVLDLNDVYYSALIPMIEQVKNGVTTVFDHHASPYNCRGSLMKIAEAATEAGVRNCLCYEVSDRDGAKIAQDGIDENMEIVRYGLSEKDDMVKGMFGLHASMTISDETLSKCVKAMEGCDAGFHVHCAEGIEDLEDSMAKYGKGVIERWYGAGILHPKSIAVHCIHVSDKEIGMLKDSGVNVVHNPESNMGNAVGCSPVIKMFSEGVHLGLGTDGYTFDMLESYKVGNIIHKHVNNDSNVAWGEIPTMLFENNIKIANQYFKGNLGRIKEGYYADVVVADYNPHTPMNADNINGHILFGMTGKHTTTTIINGKVVMKNRELIGLDEEKIYEESRKVAVKVWEKFHK